MFLLNIDNYYFNFLYYLDFNIYLVNYYQNLYYYNLFTKSLLDSNIFPIFYSNELQYGLINYTLGYNSLLENIFLFQKNFMIIYLAAYTFILIIFNSNNLIKFNLVSFFYSILSEFEKEINSIDDLFYIISMFVVFFFL